MKKKEKVFCVHMSRGKSVAESAALSGIKGEAQGMLLLSRDDIIQEITRLTNSRKKLLKSLVLSGYERLAFGSIEDCISLVTEENITEHKLREMDLFMISEIKKPKDGAMEIKFFDRLKALERLGCADEEEGNSLPFYEALEKGARALGDSYE